MDVDNGQEMDEQLLANADAGADADAHAHALCVRKSEWAWVCTLMLLSSYFRIYFSGGVLSGNTELHGNCVMYGYSRPNGATDDMFEQSLKLY